MNAFEQLMNLSDSEKQQRGIRHTPGEIAQQPAMWIEMCDLLIERREDIAMFLRNAGVTGERAATVLLTGAGTSEYIGNAVRYGMRMRLQREVVSVPSTDFVTCPRAFLLSGQACVVVSFARSGNSPESIATYDLVRQLAPDARQIIITCNKDGELAEKARQDANALTILLPEATNDQSLVMTSSFSTMAFAALALEWLAEPEKLRTLAKQLGTVARRIMQVYANDLKEFITQPAERILYLGSNALFGTMEECRLKMLEMTNGKIAANVNSFLGLRHGPQVFVNKACLIVAALSSDPYARQYELDLLNELQQKGQGRGTLIICDRATDNIRQLATLCIELFPDGHAIADEYRVMTDVVAGQILGTFKSLAVGLNPDNPSENGIIIRVVQGVPIYPLEPRP